MAGGMHGRGACVQGAYMTGEGVHCRGCMAGGAWQGVHGRRYMARGVHGVGGGACIAGETATELGGTHLTGMHSCYNFV